MPLHIICEITELSLHCHLFDSFVLCHEANDSFVASAGAAWAHQKQSFTKASSESEWSNTVTSTIRLLSFVRWASIARRIARRAPPPTARAAHPIDRVASCPNMKRFPRMRFPNIAWRLCQCLDRLSYFSNGFWFIVAQCNDAVRVRRARDFVAAVRHLAICLPVVVPCQISTFASIWRERA